MSRDEREPPWYEAGLRFECTRCGRCCRGPGNVWVSDEEIEALAALTGHSVEVFRKSHVKRAGRRGLVLGQKRNQDCIFWDSDTGCTVYGARPKQCRTYPFWRAVVDSEYNWRSEQRSCPGVGKGPRNSAASVQAKADDDGIPAHRTRAKKKSL